MGLSKKLLLFLTILSSLAVYDLSFAFVPPSKYLVDRITKRHLDFKRVWIKSAVSLVDGEKTKDPLFTEVLTLNAEAGILESRSYNLEGTEIYSAKRILLKDHVSSVPVSNFLMFVPDSNILAAALKARQVPIRLEEELIALETEEERRKSEILSLQRWEGFFAWVVGTQLWIQKDSFLPLRLISSDAKSEIVYKDYFFSGNFGYPREIRVLKDEKPSFVAKMIKVVMNPKEEKSEPAQVGGLTDAGNDADSETKELIQLYYSTVR